MNDERKSPLAIGFLAAGLLLFALSFYLAFRSTTDRDLKIRLASVSRETGQVFVVRANFAQKEKIEKRGILYNLDSIETNDTGEALISFESTFRVKVIEDSLVTLEKVQDSKNSHVVLILKKGDVRIDSFGRDGELFIAKNGQRILASDYESSPLKATPVESALATPTPPVQSQLTEEEISAVMNSNRSSFFKCYAQLLQKNPQAKGDVTLSFTIENSGKLSVYEMTSAQLAQDEFKKCLLEVMGRIAFRPFQGSPVSTIFPMKFE